MLNELRMAIDFGGSSTKVLASYGEEKLAFAMRSEVVEVPKGMLSQRDKVQGSNPLHEEYGQSEGNLRNKITKKLSVRNVTLG
jgi:hypothetical protein